MSNYNNLVSGILTGNVIGLDALHSGNGSNLRSVKRMELVYKNIDLKFAINPSDYTQREPNRASITQTKGGAWIDAWGAGIVEFNIKGITGVYGKKDTATGDTYINKLANTAYDISRVFSGDSGVDVGYQRWKALRDLFRSVYNSVQNGEEVTDLIQFYNFTDNEYWYCYPTQNGIELYRSQSKPHVYQYTINLWGLRRIGEPLVSTGVIGNPYSEEYISNSSTGVEIDTSEISDEDELLKIQAAVGAELFELEDPEESSDVFDSTKTSVTNKNSSYTYSGGNAFSTKSQSVDSQADVIVVTNTKTKNNKVLQLQSIEFSNSLAPIIGGYNGLLIPVTAYNSCKNLGITELGNVNQVPGFDKTQLSLDSDDQNILLDEVLFVSTVSPSAVDVFTRILRYDTTILDSTLYTASGSTAYEKIIQNIKNSTYYGSTLYSYIIKYQSLTYLSALDTKYLQIVMLESMTLYYYVTKLSQAENRLSFSISLSDINRLIQNINSLILYLQFNSTEFSSFYIQNIIYELRKLYKLVVKIKAEIVEYM